MNWSEREQLAPHPMAQKLFRIIEKKKSNLALAADVTSQKKLLELADTLGPFISVLKTHVDILDDFTPDFGKKLREIAEKHQFLIFEDRKFSDIGHTVALQYRAGIYRIADWADIINAHVVPGEGIIEGLKSIGLPKGQGLLLLAQMSSSKTLAKGAYLKQTVAWGEKHSDFVMGFISLKKLSHLPGLIHFTPGVKMERGKDSLGQRYRTLEEILLKNQSDIIIVGRDIFENPNPVKQAEIYQQRAWEISQCKAALQ